VVETDDAQMLTIAGLALFGEHWKNPLARALNIKRDTLDDWMLRDLAVPAGVWSDICKMLDERRPRLDEAATLLSAGTKSRTQKNARPG